MPVDSRKLELCDQGKSEGSGKRNESAESEQSEGSGKSDETEKT